jgi:deoxyribodipyrimidine photo-lyase
VPELARLPSSWIHHPWQAPPAALAAAGVEMGRTYRRPIVSHLVSREVALEAYQEVRRTPRNEGR